MTLTPGLTLLGLFLVLVSIPLAFSFGPFVIGAIVLFLGTRRAHRGLSAAASRPADPAMTPQSAVGPAARTASLTPPANASKLSTNIAASLVAIRS